MANAGQEPSERVSDVGEGEGLLVCEGEELALVSVVVQLRDQLSDGGAASLGGQDVLELVRHDTVEQREDPVVYGITCRQLGLDQRVSRPGQDVLLIRPHPQTVRVVQ